MSRASMSITALSLYLMFFVALPKVAQQVQPKAAPAAECPAWLQNECPTK